MLTSACGAETPLGAEPRDAGAGADADAPRPDATPRDASPPDASPADLAETGRDAGASDAGPGFTDPRLVEDVQIRVDGQGLCGLNPELTDDGTALVYLQERPGGVAEAVVRAVDPETGAVGRVLGSLTTRIAGRPGDWYSGTDGPTAWYEDPASNEIRKVVIVGEGAGRTLQSTRSHPIPPDVPTIRSIFGFQRGADAYFFYIASDGPAQSASWVEIRMVNIADFATQVVERQAWSPDCGLACRRALGTFLPLDLAYVRWSAGDNEPQLLFGSTTSSCRERWGAAGCPNVPYIVRARASDAFVPQIVSAEVPETYFVGLFAFDDGERFATAWGRDTRDVGFFRWEPETSRYVLERRATTTGSTLDNPARIPDLEPFFAGGAWHVAYQLIDRSATIATGPSELHVVSLAEGSSSLVAPAVVNNVPRHHNWEGEPIVAADGNTVFVYYNRQALTGGCQQIRRATLRYAP